MKIYSIPSLVMASICFAISLYETLAWARRDRRSRDLAFVLTCLGGTLFELFCAFEYNVDAPIQSLPWLKAEAITISLTSLAFLWYIALATRLVKRPYLIAFLAWNALAVASQFLDLGELSWSENHPFVRRVALPLGLDFVYREVEAGPVLTLINLAGFVFLAYSLWIVAKYRRLGHPRRVSGTALGSALLLARFAERRRRRARSLFLHLPHGLRLGRHHPHRRL